MITAEYTIPGLHLRDHVVTVPLDWGSPDDGRTIEVFAREVVDVAKRNETLPLLLFLQGGPGGKSPRPTGRDGWLDAALKRFRVILLDQRGTGRSTRVQGDTIAGFKSAQDAADYLLKFRADSIVRDAEFLREHEFAVAQWSTLGQSYGGFLTLNYLSTAPQSLSACYVAGGLASIEPSADEVYRRTYPRVIAKNRKFYERYPHDADSIGRIADLIDGSEVLLPDGDRLSVRRLQLLGLDFGMKPGYDRVHWIFDEAWQGGTRESPALSDAFVAEVMQKTSFDDNPLFMVLQEGIYGNGSGASVWAADRERANHPEFGSGQRPLFFTGEMMFPWMLDEIRSLRPFKAAAEALASVERYSTLYDLDRLGANEVPVSAVVYHDDMYVDAGLSLETSARVGNLHAWVTNEYEHDGLHGPEVAEKLFGYTEEREGKL
jgi:pimeloyl-ACP methyl ester carboxylesterase